MKLGLCEQRPVLMEITILPRSREEKEKDTYIRGRQLEGCGEDDDNDTDER